MGVHIIILYASEEGISSGGLWPPQQAAGGFAVRDVKKNTRVC